MIRDKNDKNPPLPVVGKHYKVIRKLDTGAFGQIFQAISQKTNKKYAVKFQQLISDHPQLIYQCKIYNYLHSDQTVTDKGIPHVYYCTMQGDYNVLVMDLMGLSLQALFNQTLRKFSLKTTLMLLDQMLQRIAYVHSRSFIHRDIKPDNFCIGLNQDKKKLFLLDFGLAKRYRNKDGRHIPFKDGKNMTGTARYASVNTHKGYQQSTRDDLQSLSYAVMYFLMGKLPWQGLKAHNKKDKYQRIKKRKQQTTPEDLCKGFPVQFLNFVKKVKSLQFDQQIDYQKQRDTFQELFKRNNYEFDHIYDWVILNEKKQQLEKNKNERKEPQNQKMEIEGGQQIIERPSNGQQIIQA